MVNFCPQCGTKLYPGFKFCPSCGDKLPTEEPAEPETSQLSDPLSDSVLHPAGGKEGKKFLTSSRKQKAFPQLEKTTSVITQTPDKMSLSSPKIGRGSPQVKEQEAYQTSSVTLPTPDKKSFTSPRKHKTSPQVKDEEVKQTSSVILQSPVKCKSRKQMCAVEPILEGTVVCDQSSKKWKLVELLWQTDLDITYAVCPANQHLDSNGCKHILRLGAKERHLFNEQNFHLRAAKPDAVDKWLKLHKMDFLGIPSCEGFGLYESYRFLVFPSMGQTLQSVIDEGTGSLSEKAALQLALRLLDSLEFIHEKEYTHADIHAGNIYINTDSHTEVFLSGFGHAFRFCPGGKHVEYRQGSRIADQGNLNFISLDSHKGVGPSCRSDLQSLGYCMLSWMTGTLPWSPLTHTSSTIATEKERYISDFAGLVSVCYKKKKVSSALLEYLSNVMTLQYTEKPDYSLLKARLHESLQKMGGSLKEPLDLQVKP